MADSDARRAIPRTDHLLRDTELLSAAAVLGPTRVKEIVVEAQDRARRGLIAADDVLACARSSATDAMASTTTLQPIINATGVVLHTNIGRAPLTAAAIDAITRVAGYVDIEYDVATGQRSTRGRGTLQALVDRVPSAEAALVLNNGAAALVLATTALAAGREVVVSRGEMVEIGDGFRLPDLIASTGARLREVGTTNRTTLADYLDALGPDTGVVLKVHPSNFVISGFTRAVEVGELAPALAGRGIPLVVDIGSGLLQPDSLLPDEPSAESTLAAGADVVTASGDKLLGGPQAGIALGSTEVIHRLRRHPLARALRVDKLTLAALEATLRGGPTLVSTALHTNPSELRDRTAAVAAALAERGVSAEVVPASGAVGGGGAPGLSLPGWALSLPEGHAVALRHGSPAIVARVEAGRCLVDLRCVPTKDDAIVIAGILAATRI